MSKIILTNLILFLISSAYSQPHIHDEVMRPIQELLEAMETNDSSLAASAFTTDALLHSVSENNAGTYKHHTIPASKLISAFGRPKQETWSEPIWNETVQLDGGLASVWVEYAFYIDTAFSHCGVDAFQLIKTESGWKIFSLTDTRRKDNCAVPKEIQDRYKE